VDCDRFRSHSSIRPSGTPFKLSFGAVHSTQDRSSV
jgi:hypothetical protein